MADQLLSQSDVDALISSLTQNTGNKPEAPVNKTVASAPVQSKPSVSAPVSRAPAAQTPSTTKPISKPVSVPVKAEVNGDTSGALNARLAELSRQLGDLNTAVKRIDLIEKRLSELEAKCTRVPASVKAEQMVQQLAEEMKTIVNNLKGTPGYGVRHKFACEKCDDHGHVAVQFRCTKCGHERWYGWWPEKK